MVAKARVRRQTRRLSRIRRVPQPGCETWPVPSLLLSVDFEDWHQLVHRAAGAPDWDRRRPALERQTATLLDLLDSLAAKATFFFLGITLRLYPELAREVVARGH